MHLQNNGLQEKVDEQVTCIESQKRDYQSLQEMHQTAMRSQESILLGNNQHNSIVTKFQQEIEQLKREKENKKELVTTLKESEQLLVSQHNDTLSRVTKE